MKKGLLFLLLILGVACSNDGDTPFDPATQLEIDIRAIDDYLNANNLTAQIHDSGVRYIINSEGNGRFPEDDKRVFVDYEVFLLDGTFIDTSIEQTARDNDAYNSQRSYRPFDFVIGNGGVIAGFDIASRLLSEEGSGTFLIPSAHAYKNTGKGTVPPNAVLLFNIQLVEIMD